MRPKSYYQLSGTSTIGRDYTEAFLRRVHAILGRGYAALIPSGFAHAEEEDITGELVRAVEEILDDANAPRWTRWFSVHEEPPIHHAFRRGRRRLRLDIRIDSSQSLPRCRMRFEAKRLGNHHGASAYLGKDGLQCFLDGRYASNDAFAGMLGYVQVGHPEQWALKIMKAIEKNRSKLHARMSSAWRKTKYAAELQSTYRTDHDRPKLRRSIKIFHTFLLFN